MSPTRHILRSALCALAILSLLATGAAHALILHPAPDGNDSVPAGQRPSDAVMASWWGYASAVVVSPSQVITTCHQRGGINTRVYIQGDEYKVASYYSHPQADLRVVNITDDGVPAELTEWADIYRGSDEAGMTAVIGGWGLGRGAEAQTGGVTYGYEWGYAPGALRWGRNVISGPGYVGEGWESRTIEADFDGVGEGGHIEYEAILADRDSGGGWFVESESADQWLLAGLNRSVDHLHEAWFRNKYNPASLDPDGTDAVRISVYADWIDYAMNRPLMGDANVDGEVGLADLTALADNYGEVQTSLNWMDGDFTGDWAVGLSDLAALADNYGRRVDLYIGPDDPGGTLPEPGIAALLAVGAIGLIRRRRR